MSKPLKDLTGKHFGYLTVLKLCKNNKNINCWLCKCVCGNEKIITGSSLQCGDTKSCGCKSKELQKEAKQKNKKRNYYINYSEDVLKLYDEKNNFALIDKNDFNKIKEYYWYQGKNNYWYGRINGKKVYLHRIIMDANSQQVVDHINHELFNNTKNNLRIVTYSQNGTNKIKGIRNTSGIVGVSWDKERQKWTSYININKKVIHLGRFLDFNDAVKARKEAEEKYYKEYSYDNSIKQSEKK